MKKILSMFLALCMVVTMLPVTVMAEEIHIPIGTSGEIIHFAPLTETEKTVSLGTSNEDLELPETLTATVRTAVSIGEDSVQDSGSPGEDTETGNSGVTPPTTASEPEWEENTADIPVEWDSAPEYDPETEGEYVFTPVIEGYTVSAELPKIIVTVGVPMLLELASTDVAQIGDTGYATLQGAVDAVEDGQTIRLLSNIALAATVTVATGDHKSFALDLNGKTLDGGSNTAITHNGTGVLTIQNSGKVQNNSTSFATGAINNLGTGSILVTGGTVQGKETGIFNQRTGTITVSGGTISGVRGIFNNSGGAVNISGGSIQSTGDKGNAIYTNEGGNITISGDANVTSINNNANDGTISLWFSNHYRPITLTISGGTIENTAGGNAISRRGDSSGDLTANISIPDGKSALIKGCGYAMNFAPTLVRATVTASANFDGNTSITYNVEDITTYKYLKFEPGLDTTVNDLNLTDKLTSPVTGGSPATAIADDAQYTGTVAWNSAPAKFLGGTSYTATVTLTAQEGYTFSGVAQNAFSHTGATSVTNSAGSGTTLTVTIVFPQTAARELQRITIMEYPTKVVYKYGETFDKAGMVVEAAYNDGTADADFSAYTVDKTGPLILSDTRITLTANGTNITTSLTITVTKADGPSVQSVSFSFDGVNANKLMGATALMEYSLNGGSNWIDCIADIDLTAELGSITAENDIKVRVKESATHHAGTIQTIDITQPSTPTGIGKTDETLALKNGTITGVSNLMEYKRYSDASYTVISGSTVTGLAPGTYLVRIKATGTALASLDVTVIIVDFVKTTPTTGDLVYDLIAVDYDGTAKPVSVMSGSGKTLGAITVKYNGSTTVPTNAGTYEITVDIARNAEYNAVTGLSLGSYTINKIAYTGTNTVSASVLTSGQIGATVTLPTLPTGANYGTPTVGGTMTMTGMSITGTTLTYTAPASTAGQSGTMTIAVTGATNYNDYSIIVTVIYTAKTPQAISYIDTTVAKTYGDAKFVNPLTQTIVNGTITYASDDTSVATVNPTTGEVTIIAVGDRSATITATAAETATHARAAASYTVTVARKDLTLKAEDKSMTKGDGLPTFTYTATGLVNGDTVTTAPNMSTDMDGNVGTFDITITGGVVANAASYDITHTKGILTVAERLFTITVVDGTGSGSYAESATVTITANDRSGYTFTGWSGANVTFADASKKTTSFTMPAKAVTVTANYRQNSSGGGNTSSPTPTPDPDKTDKSGGQIEKEQQQNAGAPAVSVNNSSDELKSRVFTAAEQDMVAKGENAKVILKVKDISASVSKEEKALIQEQLFSKGDVSQSVLYMDLSLYKQVGSRDETRITETNGKIRISLEVPERFWNTDVTKSRAFYVVRIHVKEVTRIDGSYDPTTHLFTFETDRFSTYALTYQDSSIQSYQDFYHLQLTAKANKTSQTLFYKKVANVDGYLIYGAVCGKEMKKLAEVPADVTSYTVKNLKAGTYYKYQIKAYRIIDGEMVIIMTSKVVHSVTQGKTYANPTKVTLNVASVELAAGETKTVSGQVVLPKGKKGKEHTAAIRYESTNKKVATVNSKGKIIAKAKGICYVYVYAQNGVYKRIKVTVE